MQLGRSVALGAVLLTLVASACGDDPARRVVRDGDAGGGGEAGEATGTAGAAATAGAPAGGEGGGGAQASIDLATYCQAVGDGYSAWLTYCYGSDGYPEDEAAAFAAQTTMRCMSAEPGVEAGRLAFDGVVAASCVAVMDAMNCDGFDFIEGLPECRGVFAPLVELGGECFPGELQHFSIATTECLDGYCDLTGQACPGECVALKQDDDACTTGGQCQPESYCDTEVCVPRVADGETCIFGDACQLGSSCFYAPAASEGTCMQRSTVGQACDETEPCSFGFYCLAGECLSKVATGEPCEVERNCPDGDRCLDRDGDGPTCGEPGGHNVPCQGSRDCIASHYCSTVEPLVCLPRIAIGNPCSEGQCAVGAWCNTEAGECQASGGAGDSCLMNGFPAFVVGVCEPGLFCMSYGECQPAGAAAQPCNTTNVATCEAGLFCSRVDRSCHPPGDEGDFCNPFSPLSCADGLACLCTDAACQSYGGDPNANDTLHTCAARRQDGDACFGTPECAELSSCIGEAELTCVPNPTECLP